MATAMPLDLAAASPKSPNATAMQAWIAQEIAQLTPEERAKYDASEAFHAMVHGALEYEWRNSGPTPMEREAAEKYGGDMARCFVEQFVVFALRDQPAEDAARIAALRVERYGEDFQREVADIQDGTHPAQQLRC
jgi:hypothetical protein